jgi:hypothetical protein
MSMRRSLKALLFILGGCCLVILIGIIIVLADEDAANQYALELHFKDSPAGNLLGEAIWGITGYRKQTEQLLVRAALSPDDENDILANLPEGYEPDSVRALIEQFRHAYNEGAISPENIRLLFAARFASGSRIDNAEKARAIIQAVLQALGKPIQSSDTIPIESNP